MLIKKLVLIYLLLLISLIRAEDIKIDNEDTFQLYMEANVRSADLVLLGLSNIFSQFDYTMYLPFSFGLRAEQAHNRQAKFLRRLSSVPFLLLDSFIFDIGGGFRDYPQNFNSSGFNFNGTVSTLFSSNYSSLDATLPNSSFGIGWSFDGFYIDLGLFPVVQLNMGVPLPHL